MDYDVDLGQAVKRFLVSLLSRKLWLAIGGSLFLYLQLADGGMNLQELLTVVAPILSFIGVEGVADAVERNSYGNANVSVEPTEKVTTGTNTTETVDPRLGLQEVET